LEEAPPSTRELLQAAEPKQAQNKKQITLNIEQIKQDAREA